MEEYQDWKGAGNQGFREEYNVITGEKYLLPFNTKAVGKNIKWKRGEGALKTWGRKSRLQK